MALPKPQGGSNGLAKLPAPEASGDYAPWLTVQDLNAKGKTKLKLTGDVRENTGSKFGAGIIVGVTIGKKEFAWTVKFSSGNYRRMFDQFGADPKKWKGTIAVEAGEYLGKDFIKVCD